MKQSRTAARIILIAFTGLFLVASLASAGAEELMVWWNTSYYPEEDQKLTDTVKAWEKQSGNTVNLVLLPPEDIPKKLLAALDAKEPPDIAFGHALDLQHTPKWAYDNLLEDVSEVITPLAGTWLPVAMEATFLKNGATGKRAYYGVPIEQESVHIHYWASLLASVGLKEREIPAEWDRFWSFWCDMGQVALRMTGRHIYGIGQPMSGLDISYLINMFLNAHDVAILDTDGNLLIDDPKVRTGIEAALTDFTAPYRKKCTAPNAVTWQNSDNALNFLNQTTLMTPNPTLSLPVSQITTNPANYRKNIRTLLWPKGISGKPIAVMTSVKSALVFSASKHKEAAKDFLRFLIRPENLGPFVKGSQGRWFPVRQDLLDDPYWKGTDDPHRSVEYRQYTLHRLIPFQQVYNYKYATVQTENLWGTAANRMAEDNWPAAKAVDELVKRMKELLR